MTARRYIVLDAEREVAYSDPQPLALAEKVGIEAAEAERRAMVVVRLAETISRVEPPGAAQLVRVRAVCQACEGSGYVVDRGPDGGWALRPCTGCRS